MMNIQKPTIKKFDSPWISEGIGEDYKLWQVAHDLSERSKKEGRIIINGSSRVFIESATGTGKTSFILDTLLPYAMKKGRSILYVSNRTALL